MILIFALQKMFLCSLIKTVLKLIKISVNRLICLQLNLAFSKKIIKIMIEKAEDQLTISNIKIKSKIVIKSPLPIISN
jgi:hypothetical protein